MKKRPLLESQLQYTNVVNPEIPAHASFGSIDELLAMNWVVHLSKAVQAWDPAGGGAGRPKVFEIGTYFGLSMVQFSRMIPGAELHSLNILPEQVEGDPLQEEILPLERIGWYAREQRVCYTQHFGDSRTFDYSNLPGPFDVIFIDGRHEREYIDNDTQKTLGLLAPGGVMVWHDYRPECLALNAPDASPDDLQRHHQVGVNTAEAINALDLALFDGTLTHVEGTPLVYWVKAL